MNNFDASVSMSAIYKDSISVAFCLRIQRMPKEGLWVLFIVKKWARKYSFSKKIIYLLKIFGNNM